VPPLPGRHYRMRGSISAVTVGLYLVLILLEWLILADSLATAAIPVYLLIGVTALLLVRYLSTTYSLDDAYLHARRILGGRRMRLEDIRKIETTRLRELSPTGFFGSWGWRGRMWSPVVGKFDAIYTDPSGILVTGGEVPLFISPHHAPEFARELSRRARSYSGPLEIDHGAPGAGT
jgi:hypothetical protein